MSWETYAKYPIVFLAGFLATLILTPLWMRIAPALGYLDQPGGRKIHRNPVPRGGGIALFLGFQLVCAVVFLYPWKPFAGQISDSWWLPFLLVSSFVVLLGLIDDRFNVKPFVKLGGQTGIAIGAYVIGLRVQNVLGLGLPMWADLVITVLWFVVLMNAFNLIDGIDGLASGIALIASMGIGISMVFRSEPGDTLLFIGFAGVCLGFLRHNFYPASVFLGDTGSLFIGFTIAALSLSTNSKGTALAGIGVPLLAVGVPLFDTLLAVWRRSMRRILNGENNHVQIQHADADHLHHRLLNRVSEQSRVAYMLYGFTLFLTLAGMAASIFRDRALGILTLTVLIAAYTIVRHLAWIELRASGRVILRGLSRPIRRNRTLLYYIVVDLIILNAGYVMAVTLVDLHEQFTEKALKNAWLSGAPFSVFLPFLGLLLFRAYSRVWYLARVSEYLSAGFAVLLGVIMACGINLVAHGDTTNTLSVVLTYIIYAGIAAPAVVTSRAAVRLVQDLMTWRGKIIGAGASLPRVLVCGAGYQTTLFLRQHSFYPHDKAMDMDVIGLVSDDEAIRGHFVHGIRVLGSPEEVPALVASHQIDTVYLVEPLKAEAESALLASLKDLAVKIIRWETQEKTVQA